MDKVGRVLAGWAVNWLSGNAAAARWVAEVGMSVVWQKAGSEGLASRSGGEGRGGWVAVSQSTYWVVPGASIPEF